MGTTRRVLVVDGNNILMRAVKAMEYRPGGATTLNNNEGVVTGGVFVFINMLSRHVREEKPDRMVVCWDGGRSAQRMALHPGYKQGRSSRGDVEDEHAPFVLAKEFLSLAGIHHVELPGVEADDLIGSYWRTKGNDDRLIILSNDKDFFQLLDGWTEQVRPGATEDRWTSNRVRTDIGCKPEHIPLMMALTGDAGDGVPGVPGFGNKTACKALSQHDWDLDAFLATTDPKWIKKIAGYEVDARRALDLVDLRNDPLGVIPRDPPPLPSFAPTGPESVLWEALMAFVDEYDFSTVHARLVGGDLWYDPQGIASV